jgi:hypothetical protein
VNAKEDRSAPRSPMLDNLQLAIIGSLEFVMLNLLCHGRWDAAKARKGSLSGSRWKSWHARQDCCRRFKGGGVVNV